MPSEIDNSTHLLPLFVYGTLRANGSNHWRMKDARFISKAIVPGLLYRIDWYPGLIIQQSAPPVHGEIYLCDPVLLQELDAFEGDVEYKRVMTHAQTPGGKSIDVYAWEYLHQTHNLELIPSGDWLQYLAL